MFSTRAALLVDLDADFTAEIGARLAWLGIERVESATAEEAAAMVDILGPRVVVVTGEGDPAARIALCRRLRRRTLAPIVVVTAQHDEATLDYSREPSIDACLVRAVGVAALSGQLPTLMARSPRPPVERRRLFDRGVGVIRSLGAFALQPRSERVRLVQ